MSILTAIVSHPNDPSDHEKFGFAALKPALDAYPQFLEHLASGLSEGDQLLGHNALQLLNAVLRDSMSEGGTVEWESLFRKYESLGVTRSVHLLMQDFAIQDLAHSLLDFQQLTKMLLHKWKETAVDLHRSDHRQQLRAVLRASKTTKSANDRDDQSDGLSNDDAKPRDPDKWQKLGFQSESPIWEFDEVGFLGLLDLTNFAHKSKEAFQRLLQEQNSKSEEFRCPIARAALSVTSILFDHFEIDQATVDLDSQYGAIESRSNLDKLFKPLLLQWARLHTAGVQAFVRLWATSGARAEDYMKIEELTRILLEEVVGLAPITRDITEVENSIATYELGRLREDQMGLLELTHEEAWGHHLKQVKRELHDEAMEFVKEQRIRCLLQGSWFASPTQSTTPLGTLIPEKQTVSWRYARLSYNRRFLHYDDFDSKTPGGKEPGLDSLDYRVDLSTVSSIGSDVAAGSPTDERSSASMKTNTTRTAVDDTSEKGRRGHTQIRINGYRPSSHASNEGRESKPKHQRKTSSKSMIQANTENGQEELLLALSPSSQTLASEWLDGLLFLLGQPPITNETTKLVEFISKYGLKIRLLNVRFEDALEGFGATGAYDKEVKIPSREGVDDDYYYDVAAI